MAFTCELSNTWGLLGRTNGYNGLNYHGLQSLGIWVGPTDSGLIYSRDTIITNTNMEAAVAQATGHQSVNMRSVYVQGSQTGLRYYYADGTSTTSISQQHATPIVDVYATISRVVFEYTHSVSGLSAIRATYTINVPSDTRIRSSQDIANIITTATGYTVTPNRYAEPRLTCVDLDDTSRSTTTTIMPNILVPSNITVETLDGDPPYLAHVSATEPNNRGQGDMWFNPITGQLSVWTNGE